MTMNIPNAWIFINIVKPGKIHEICAKTSGKIDNENTRKVNTEMRQNSRRFLKTRMGHFTYCALSGTGGPIVLCACGMFVTSISSSGNSASTIVTSLSSPRGCCPKMQSSNRSFGSTMSMNVGAYTKRNKPTLELTHLLITAVSRVIPN